MKKIVGILAAAAMASSMFAVDVASMVQFDGDVMTYDGSTFKAMELNAYDPSGDSDYIWKLSVSGDKAGAEIWSWSKGVGDKAWTQWEGLQFDWDGGSHTIAGMIAGSSSVISQTGIWFKPVDAVKVTLGHVGAKSIFNPQFGWWAQTASMWSHGYQCDVTVDALSFTAVLAGGEGGYWFDASKAGFNKVGNFWVDAKYNASFGSLQAFVTKGATVGAHGYSNWASSPLAIGVAYANMPYLQTGYGADVVLSFKDNGSNGVKFQGIDAQIGGQFGMNGMLIQLTNLVQYRDAFKYGFELKARYGIGAFEPYVQIDGYGIMDKTLSVDLGCATSVGSCSMWAALRLPFNFNAYKFNFSVPVEFTVNL